MKVLVIEDEQLAADRLKQIIEKSDASIEIVKVIDTVRDAVSFLRVNQAQLDLIFCDIFIFVMDLI